MMRDVPLFSEPEAISIVSGSLCLRHLHVDLWSPPSGRRDKSLFVFSVFVLSRFQGSEQLRSHFRLVEVTVTKGVSLGARLVEVSVPPTLIGSRAGCSSCCCSSGTPALAVQRESAM